MTVRLERDGPTAVVVLDRPEKANALDAHALHHELPAVWATVRDDPSVRVVVVTGAGDRWFTSGADLDDPDLSARVATPSDAPPVRFTARQHDVWKPVVTAVNGRCVGGGLWFVADCDVALAAEHATFANPGVSRGLLVASSAVALAARAGFPAVLRMSLMGAHDSLSATDARLAGIVERVLPGPALLDAALADAAAIAQNSPAAVEQMIRVLWGTRALDPAAALERAEAAQHAWRGHPDAREGAAAWAADRHPRWQDAGGAP